MAELKKVRALLPSTSPQRCCFQSQHPMQHPLHTVPFDPCKLCGAERDDGEEVRQGRSIVLRHCWVLTLVPSSGDGMHGFNAHEP